MRISKWVDGLARPTFAPAYWGIATHSRRSEKAHVLPPSSVSMDAYCHYALPPLEQVPGTRLGVVELGDGRGAVLCPQRGQCLTGPVAGPQGQHRAAAVAGILLRNSRQARSGPPRGGRRDLLCPLVGMGVELVGRAPAGTSRGRDDLGATVCGVGAECPLSRVCHSSGVDRAARRAETRLARGVVAHAAPGARSRAAALLRARLGRSGVVRPLVVSTYRAAGLASGVAHQYGGHLSARHQYPVSPIAQLRAAARHPVGWQGNRL